MHASGSMTALTLVEMYDLADAIEGLPGIFGLAVPDAPVRPLDLCDDRDLGLLATRFVGEQGASFACCSRMAMWNQSAIGRVVTPASARIDRRPGQPSVNAVTFVVAVRPTASRMRLI
jgi:hypothetical protein